MQRWYIGARVEASNLGESRSASSVRRPRVLLVEDDPAVAALLVASLPQFEVSARGSAEEGLALAEAEAFDVVLTDLHLPGFDGIELCRRLADHLPDLPVIVLTAHGRLDTAIAAIRAGAFDFLVKPPAIPALIVALERAVRDRALRDEVRRLRVATRELSPRRDLVGESPPMKRVYELVERVAESDASVLLTGESGTGKEVVARAIHCRSKRQAGPFVAVNCAALPGTLLESELFGHTKGAFTDARAAKTGLFALASGGTLFLDEIGEIPSELQPKLLRALQERQIRPLGATKEVPIDVRIIAATNVDLQGAMREKRFREDLYYRLAVIPIELPALRERGNDVLLLAQHFVEHFAKRMSKPVRGVSPAVAERLLAYGWPGNVRELQNCVERAVVLTRLEELGVEDLPEKVRDARRPAAVLPEGDAGELVTMDEVERRYIRRVLDAVGGNKTIAAKVLGFDRTTLYRKLERYGLNGDERA